MVAAYDEMDAGKQDQLYGSRSENVVERMRVPYERRNFCEEGSDHKTATTSVGGFTTEARHSADTASALRLQVDAPQIRHAEG